MTEGQENLGILEGVVLKTMGHGMYLDSEKGRQKEAIGGKDKRSQGCQGTKDPKEPTEWLGGSHWTSKLGGQGEVVTRKQNALPGDLWVMADFQMTG